MIKYGSDTVTELRFRSLDARIEVRDNMWVDVVVRLQTDPATPVPDDLIDLTALVICTHGGQLAQIVPQDEGMDCEYQFTPFEKEQLRAFAERPDIRERIAKAVALASF